MTNETRRAIEVARLATDDQTWNQAAMVELADMNEKLKELAYHFLTCVYEDSDDVERGKAMLAEICDVK